VSRLAEQHDSRITDALKERAEISRIDPLERLAILRNLLWEIASVPYGSSLLLGRNLFSVLSTPPLLAD
jgi:hypothetical protein